MSIRVNLPDGSVANFPQGMAPQEIQAEIERYLAQSAPQRRVMTPGQNIARDVDRLRDTVGRGDQPFQEDYDWQGEPQQARQREIPLNAMEQQAQMEAQRRGPRSRPIYAQGEPVEPGPRTRNGPRADEMPMNAMEQEFQREVARRGPPRRNAEISIREAIAQEQERQAYQQPTMGATELDTPAMRDAVRGREALVPDVNIQRGPQSRPVFEQGGPVEPGPRDRNGPRADEAPVDALGQAYRDQLNARSGRDRNTERRGPPRRNADVDIKSQRERDAEATRDKVWGAIGYGADRVAGVASAAGTGLYGLAADVAGAGLSILGATGVGSELERQSDIAYNVANDQLRKGYTSGQGKAEADYDAEPADFRRQRAEERAAAAAQAQAAPTQPAATPDAAAAQPAPAAPAAQPAGELPSARSPNAGQRTDVAMPRGLSIQGAREQGRGEQSMSFAMGDGGSVQVRKTPPAAMKNGVQSGLDFLMERADDIILKRLQAGDVAGATAFRDFVQGEQAQKGMTYMNRAVIAANYGDSDAFTSSLDRMVKAFDGDGDWQIDTKGTRLIQTDNGQAVGAMLSMRNKATGEVFEQEYMGMQNVIAALSDFGSPTAAYDRQEKRVAAAVAQKIANAKDYQSAFDEAFKEMFDKDSFVDLNGNAISQDEMSRRVQMVNERIRAVRPDLVPQSAPRPGAASGVGAVTGGSSGQPVPTWGG